jgi:hypothetical protein
VDLPPANTLFTVDTIAAGMTKTHGRAPAIFGALGLDHSGHDR